MHTTRYAHLEGYTDICSADNDCFLTTGEDGDVRIWQGFDDLDNKSIRVSDKCFAIAYKSGKIYVADDLNEVKKYDLETNEFQGVITSFTLPVTCITVNKSGSHLVCGSSDFEIHLVDLNTLKFTTFTGHEAPILNVCYDPLEKYFVSSSCDGTARFWSVNTLSQVKMLNNLHPKSNDFNDSESFCKIAWHKDGTLIAVPTQKEIQFYERESWQQKFKINLQQNNDSSASDDEFYASILCFSSDGKYILATTSTQMIYIHSLISKSMVYKYSYNKKSKICSLVWNNAASPSSNEILFCDIKGNMGSIKPTIKDSIMSSSSSLTETTISKNDAAHTSAKSKKATANVAANKTKSSKHENDENLDMDELLGLLNDDEEDSNQSAKPISKQSSSRSSSSNTLADDDSKSPKKKRKRLSKEAADGSDENEFFTTNIEEELENDDDEDDLESLEKLKMRTYKNARKEVMEDDVDSDDTKTVTSMGGDAERNAFLLESKKANKIKSVNSSIQASFQPSSTPLNLTERYMVWNSVGLITQFNKHNDDSIDIEFHNASYHHTIHVKNQMGHTMADMSKNAIVMASPGTKNSGDDEAVAAVISMAAGASSHSKLVCILINPWDGSKEWTITMPKSEYIKNVCASNTLVACVTNHKFLRVYSISGMQKEIIALNGAPLCLRAFENCIFVCYNSFMDESASAIGYSIYYVDSNAIRSNRPLVEHGMISLSDGAKLEWIGFSDEGNPYYYDSNGYLYMKCASLSSNSGSIWTPISYLRTNLNHKGDNYWIVGLAERNQSVKAILCRNSKHPNVLPRPNISIVNIQVPFCETETERTTLEQEFWKFKQLSLNVKSNPNLCENLEIDLDEAEEINGNFEAKLKESLMKMFMFACKSNKEQRAYEIATLMDTLSLQLAIKYATKTRALVLAQHLNMLVEKKSAEEFKQRKLDLEYEETRNNNHLHQYNNATTRTTANRHHDNDENNTASSNQDVIFDSSIMNVSSSHNNKLDQTGNTSQLTNLDETTYATPSAIPLTTTRINPFKVAGNHNNDASFNTSAALNSSASTFAVAKTPLNDSSKSILNDIEDKINKQQQHQSASAKEKEAWKPTSLKKLSKSKVSSSSNNTPNSSISNFLSRNKI